MRQMLMAVIAAVIAAALVPAWAQTSAPLTLDQAYEQVLVARKALQEAEGAQQRGAEVVQGDRIGTATGGSRLTEDYFRRQEQLAQEVQNARKRLDEAVARWNALR